MTENETVLSRCLISFVIIGVVGGGAVGVQPLPLPPSFENFQAKRV